ncbi:MAG: hemerythrin domain-containing protein [Streptosporangiaceae bacterium]
MTTRRPFIRGTRATREPEPELAGIVVIHRAMRQDLQRLASCLAEIASIGAPCVQSRAISRYAAALFAEICRHQANQDNILWPVLAAAAGQAVDLIPLTDDHRDIEAAIGSTRRALAAFGAKPDAVAVLLASVNGVRDMLDEHIADEEQQILPIMTRYLPADAYRRCEMQAQRKASLNSLRFSAPWLARFAQPDELRRIRSSYGWPARLLLTAARYNYARLERQAFGASLARHPDAQRA